MAPPRAFSNVVREPAQRPSKILGEAADLVDDRERVPAPELDRHEPVAVVRGGMQDGGAHALDDGRGGAQVVAQALVERRGSAPRGTGEPMVRDALDDSLDGGGGRRESRLGEDRGIEPGGQLRLRRVVGPIR